MANKKISELNSATLPLLGTEQIAIVQGGETKKVATSEFKDVVEGYFNGTNFYTDAVFIILITGETGKIYLALDTNKTYRWSGSVYIQLSTGKRKHILTYTTNNFNVANLNNISFISENAWQVGDTMINSGFTNALDAMKTNNAKLLEAPFDCRLKWLMLSFYSGGITGNFYLGTGNTDGQILNASTNINSKQIIADIDLNTTQHNLKKYYFEPTIKPDILKGDGFFMMMKAITQDHPSRYRFLCTFEIEEI